jgi:hypothetical protein
VHGAPEQAILQARCQRHQGAERKDSSPGCCVARPALRHSELRGCASYPYLLRVDRAHVNGGHHLRVLMWRSRRAMCATPEPAILPLKCQRHARTVFEDRVQYFLPGLPGAGQIVPKKQNTARSEAPQPGLSGEGRGANRWAENKIEAPCGGLLLPGIRWVAALHS